VTAESEICKEELVEWGIMVRDFQREKDEFGILVRGQWRLVEELDREREMEASKARSMSVSKSVGVGERVATITSGGGSVGGGSTRGIGSGKRRKRPGK
jgi:hypothetical protein